jgi:hypothetical protein
VPKKTSIVFAGRHAASAQFYCPIQPHRPCPRTQISCARVLRIIFVRWRLFCRHRFSRGFFDRDAIDAGLALQIVDGDVRVVPGQAWRGTEAPGQCFHQLRRVPGLSRRAALPQVDAAGAGIAVQVVLADQSFALQRPVGWCGAQAAGNRLLGRSFRQIKLDDDDTSRLAGAGRAGPSPLASHISGRSRS